MKTSEHHWDEELFKRLRSFAWVTIFVAILVIVVALAQSVLAFWGARHYGEYALPGHSAILGAATSLRNFMNRGMSQALYLAGIAVVALLVARAAFGGKPSWAPSLDHAFVAKAQLIVVVAMVYALLYAALTGIGAARLAAQALHEVRAYGLMPAPGSGHNPLAAIGMTLDRALSGLVVFFQTVLGALVIRTLVALSVKPNGSADGKGGVQ